MVNVIGGRGRGTGTEDRLVEQISDGVLQEVDTHGAQTSACATTKRRPIRVFDNPIQAHVHRVEGEETFVLSVDVVPIEVGDGHLLLRQSNQHGRLDRGIMHFQGGSRDISTSHIQVFVVAADVGFVSTCDSLTTCKDTDHIAMRRDICYSFR